MNPEESRTLVNSQDGLTRRELFRDWRNRFTGIAAFSAVNALGIKPADPNEIKNPENYFGDRSIRIVPSIYAGEKLAGRDIPGIEIDLSDVLNERVASKGMFEGTHFRPLEMIVTVADRMVDENGEVSLLSLGRSLDAYYGGMPDPMITITSETFGNLYFYQEPALQETAAQQGETAKPGKIIIPIANGTLTEEEIQELYNLYGTAYMIEFELDPASEGCTALAVLECGERYWTLSEKGELLRNTSSIKLPAFADISNTEYFAEPIVPSQPNNDSSVSM